MGWAIMVRHTQPKEKHRMDHAKIEEGVRLILEGVGEDPTRPGLLDTPARVARMYEEILAGMSQDPAELFATTFDEGHQ